MRHAHAQGATEYLVVFAVVLLIALLTISLLIGGAGYGMDTQITQSRLYWAAASPIGIEQHFDAKNSTRLMLELKNNIYSSITVVNVSALSSNGVYGSNGSTIFLSPGETKFVYITHLAPVGSNSTEACSGIAYSFAVNITYLEKGSNTKSEIGVVPVVGYCGQAGSGGAEDGDDDEGADCPPNRTPCASYCCTPGQPCCNEICCPNGWICISGVCTNPSE